MRLEEALRRRGLSPAQDNLGKRVETIEDFTRPIRQRPGNVHLWAAQGTIHEILLQYVGHHNHWTRKCG